MRDYIQFIILINIIILTSCDNGEITSANYKTDTAVTENKSIIEKKDKAQTEEMPSCIFYKQHECKTNCDLLESINNKTLKNDTLSLNISTIKDCETEYLLDTIIYSENTIDIHIKSKTPDIIIECLCLYRLDIKIKNIHTIPRKILLNGEKITRLK